MRYKIMNKLLRLSWHYQKACRARKPDGFEINEIYQQLRKIRRQADKDVRPLMPKPRVSDT